MAKAKARKSNPAASQPDAPSSVSVPRNVALPEGYKVKRQITVPVLVMKDASPPLLLKFEEKMRLSNYVDPDPAKAKEKPATIAQVTNVETGEIFQFLVPSVVESNLRRDYNGGKQVVTGTGKNQEKSWDETGTTHDYVGLVFRIQCNGKRPGKRYRDFSIMEVETA